MGAGSSSAASAGGEVIMSPPLQKISAAPRSASHFNCCSTPDMVAVCRPPPRQRVAAHGLLFACCTVECGNSIGSNNQARGVQTPQVMFEAPTQFMPALPAAQEMDAAGHAIIMIWKESAMSGRPITLLSPSPVPVDPRFCDPGKIPAWLYYDPLDVRLCIASPFFGEALSLDIDVENLFVICAATDFPAFLERGVDVPLTTSEEDRVVLLQYELPDNSGRTSRICFLEDSTINVHNCVRALSVLWLERRNEEDVVATFHELCTPWLD
eukprot:NODE_13786_length_1147_cov_2.800000.p1 GENE.NODE_13786_length_1147_cov_2.800000~~NODE_13786_length_1147_cov_2.800000.p1  ORF type:complete len:268 (-),score=58.48 NODE_13786_length_1147_cov_2.800000:97-900(-)